VIDRLRLLFGETLGLTLSRRRVGKALPAGACSLFCFGQGVQASSTNRGHLP
jgi:hypothetical protein